MTKKHLKKIIKSVCFLTFGFSPMLKDVILLECNTSNKRINDILFAVNGFIYRVHFKDENKDVFFCNFKIENVKGL